MAANKLIWRGRQLTTKAQIGVSLALESFAVNVWSEARRIVTVDTGSLRNSIRIEKLVGRKGRGYVAYRIVAGLNEGGNYNYSGMRVATGGAGSRGGVGVGIKKATQKGKQWRLPFYALYVELGTSRMAAKPFMRPAFNRFKGSFRRTVRKYLKSSIR